MVNDRQSLDLTSFAQPSGGAVEWRISDAPVPYPDAVAAMEQRVAAIAAGEAAELVWLLEHPPLYTSGTSGKSADLLGPRFPVFQTGRGGQLTYHGPGQRVAYVMMDLKRWNPDVRAYVCALERWMKAALLSFGIKAEDRPGRVGLWVPMEPYGGRPGEEAKIAALGVRVRRWVSFHGVALNVDPDLSHYRGIVPCGVSEHGVTSLARLGLRVGMSEVDGALKRAFAEVFARPSPRH
jgi:lipoyl(octanoyl) transferase